MRSALLWLKFIIIANFKADTLFWRHQIVPASFLDVTLWIPSWDSVLDPWDVEGVQDSLNSKCTGLLDNIFRSQILLNCLCRPSDDPRMTKMEGDLTFDYLLENWERTLETIKEIICFSGCTMQFPSCFSRMSKYPKISTLSLQTQKSPMSVIRPRNTVLGLPTTALC